METMLSYLKKNPAGRFDVVYTSVYSLCTCFITVVHYSVFIVNFVLLQWELYCTVEFI